ncbi:co-chaperone DjlA [Salinisphaera hydrothermalis]|uniref:DnaJ-like membrane chaperone protein n=1 Tax=Salinisphaera hydrothermalis (strain C41B8) TaxID=1304275 RepID=A0A084ILC3_SALHC|nr:co-chaperone DjlA [Salinisphaera hydrothermalis]KEZ77507.1 DnaJ-like membrane chaperone protein [Salinisphaera hydrothermalis C41B8]
MLIAIVIGALIGASFMGFPGALLGGVIGYWIIQLLVMAFRRGNLGKIQSQFLESTFAVMGALCKADGQVTRDEIRVAEQLFDRLRLSDMQKDDARRAFNRGKQGDFDLDGEVAKFVQVARGQRALHQMFLQVQIAAIAADGKVSDAEHAALMRVARGLGLSEAEIRQLEAMLGARGAAGGATSGDGMGSKAGVSREDQLKQAYDVLGISQEASDAEVKKAYRRQMSQNHPDKLASKGMPESMREMAEQKTREIGAAYERIREARGIS